MLIDDHPGVYGIKYKLYLLYSERGAGAHSPLRARLAILVNVSVDIFLSVLELLVSNQLVGPALPHLQGEHYACRAASIALFHRCAEPSVGYQAYQEDMI